MDGAPFELGDRLLGMRINGEWVEGYYRGRLDGEYDGFSLLDGLNHRELSRCAVVTTSLHYPEAKSSTQNSAIAQNSGDSGILDLSDRRTTESSIQNSAIAQNSGDSGILGTANVWQRCGEYFSRGKKYYRYQWGCGFGLEASLHIRGGQINNPQAIANLKQVKDAIAQGKPPCEVMALVKRLQR